jgi:outer membrane protein
MVLASVTAPARRLFVFAFCLAAGALAHGQQPLTLEDALLLARQRNGTIQAAFLDLQAAEARVAQTRSALFPTLFPTFRYSTSRRELGPGTGPRFVTEDGSQAFLTASWRILDSGERHLNLEASRRSAEAQREIALQNLRSVLFTVHQQYLDTLRAEELQRIADAQVIRTDTILQQTLARVAAGDAPRKDTLQARADALNAVVQQLQAQTRTASIEAALKGTIGWDTFDPLPELVRVSDPDVLGPEESMIELASLGIAQRPDLLAQRRRVEAQQATARRIGLDAGITFGLDASIDQQLIPRSLESRALTLSATYPLFDAGRSRQAAREARLVVDASQADLRQSERQAQAEIESAYIDLSVTGRRVEAARLALEAAQLNYEAAVEAQRLGAADIVEVLTAQVSLVTAESNYVEAIYDYHISDVRLRLVTGRPVPGEAAALNP